MFIGKKVKLSNFRPEDGEIFSCAQWDEDYLDTISDGVLHPYTANDWTKVFEEGSNSNENIEFIIRNIEDDQPIGFISLNDIDFRNRKCEMGVGIMSYQSRGKGYGSEAISLVLEYAFNQLNIRKIILEVLEHNEQGIHVYEKLGFKREAEFKEEFFREGIWRSVYRYRLFQNDWKDLK